MLTYAGREEAASIQAYSIFVKRLLRLISQVSCLPPPLSSFFPLFFFSVLWCGGVKRTSRSRQGWRSASWSVLLRIHIRQHASACVSIRQHTSAYVSIRQHTHRGRVGKVGGVPLGLSYFAASYRRMLTDADVC
jgi:hypothetical protein